jgi:hypothetical protein
VQSGYDCAVRERKFLFAVGLDRYIVAQNGTQAVEIALFVGHGDQPSVAVSGGDFVYEDLGALSTFLSKCPGRVADHGRHRCNGNQQDSDPSHTAAAQKANGACGEQTFAELGHDLLIFHFSSRPRRA